VLKRLNYEKSPKVVISESLGRVPFFPWTAQASIRVYRAAVREEPRPQQFLRAAGVPKVEKGK
jgi:hypothetical protein